MRILGAAALVEAREDDAELAAGERRGGAPGVERALEVDRAREAPERPLGDVKRGVAVLARGGQLEAGDEQHVAREHDLHR